MSGKFTPGGWQASHSGAYPVVETPLGERIATLPIRPSNTVDAFLIAAAPDLLAACRKALPIVAAMCNALGETCDEEAAAALGSLRDVLALFPED